MRGTFSAARTADRQARVGGAGTQGGVAQAPLETRNQKHPGSEICSPTAELQTCTDHAFWCIKLRPLRQILALFFSFSSSYLP